LGERSPKFVEKAWRRASGGDGVIAVAIGHHAANHQQQHRLCEASRHFQIEPNGGFAWDAMSPCAEAL